MKKKVSIALIFVLMLSCLTACGGGEESTASGESSVAAEETKQTEKTSVKDGSGDRVFERDLNRMIPEGYEEVEWDDDVPFGVTEMYTLIENPQTEMIGLADFEGNVIIEAEYSELEYVLQTDDQYFFSAEYEGETGIINGGGEETVAFESTEFKLHDKRMLRFEVKDNAVICISIDIMNGKEIGRFEIETSTPDYTVSSTQMGPNDWIFPVVGNPQEAKSLGIWSAEGVQLYDKEMKLEKLEGVVRGLETTDLATSDGYSCQPIQSSDGSAEAELCIFDKEGNIVAGPYKKSSEGHTMQWGLIDDVFLIYENFWNNGENNQYIDLTMYIPDLDKELSMEGVISTTDDLAGVFENNVALIYPEGDGIAKFDLSTGKLVTLQDTGSVSKVFNSSGRYIYISNNTYKISDLEGNIFGDERYYDLCNFGESGFLKQENGDWVYVDGDGNLSEETGLFHGDEDAPTTYNDLPIVGFWEYEGTPCVVVEEEDKQVGYAL